MTDTNPENQFAIRSTMRVRRLSGIYEIIDSRMLGKLRRYDLRAVPGTGAVTLATEAWGSDMQPVPCTCSGELLNAACPVHGPAVIAAQKHAHPAGASAPAPDVAQPVAGTVRSPQASPGADSDPSYGESLDEGAFGGELDPYSPGANSPDALPEEPGELKAPYKPVRRFPQRTQYEDLGGVVYNARLKGFENHTTRGLSELAPNTPIAIVVTQEANGHAIWIILSDPDGEFEAALETYYPDQPGSVADSFEYAVLLALRQIPIRTEDLEITLMSPSS